MNRATLRFFVDPLASRHLCRYGALRARDHAGKIWHEGYGATPYPSELFVMNDEDRAALIAHENKMIRRLRFLVELTFATIAQDHSITLDQAWEHVRALKAAAVTMFPGKEETFDLIYLPRFSRLLAERFRAN